MRFLFVDKISKISLLEIDGEITFPLGAPLTFSVDGENLVHPGLISEAIGQLASWKIMRDLDFACRPLYLFADQILTYAPVKLGKKIKLRAKIEPSSSSDAITFSGEALVDGIVVQRLEKCTTSPFPIDQLDDPARIAQSFKDLQLPDVKPLSDESPSYQFDNFISDLLEENSNCVRAKCFIPKEALFFRDHFPRKPITPIVLINDIITRVTETLFRDLQPRIYLFPRKVERVIIKSIISPDETFDITVKRKNLENNSSTANIISVTGEIFKNSKQILRGLYEYQIVRKVGDICN